MRRQFDMTTQEQKIDKVLHLHHDRLGVRIVHLVFQVEHKARILDDTRLGRAPGNQSIDVALHPVQIAIVPVERGGHIVEITAERQLDEPSDLGRTPPVAAMAKCSYAVYSATDTRFLRLLLFLLLLLLRHRRDEFRVTHGRSTSSVWSTVRRVSAFIPVLSHARISQ